MHHHDATARVDDGVRLYAVLQRVIEHKYLVVFTAVVTEHDTARVVGFEKKLAKCLNGFKDRLSFTTCVAACTSHERAFRFNFKRVAVRATCAAAVTRLFNRTVSTLVTL